MHKRRATLMLLLSVALGLPGLARAESEITVYYNPG